MKGETSRFESKTTRRCAFVEPHDVPIGALNEARIGSVQVLPQLLVTLRIEAGIVCAFADAGDDVFAAYPIAGIMRLDQIRAREFVLVELLKKCLCFSVAWPSSPAGSRMCRISSHASKIILQSAYTS